MSDSKAKWTILTYIAAHNDLEDFGPIGEDSLNKILSVGSTADLKLAVLYDRYEGATRYIAGEPGQPEVVEDLGDIDSGDPDALLETVSWAYERCPAERYGLVLWSHGSGWRPEELERVARQARGDAAVDTEEATLRSARPGGTALFRTTLAKILRPASFDERAVLFDDGSGHSLDTLELECVVCKVQRIIGQPLDLLGMDACVMATLEVAYQVRQHVRYLVASEELVPGTSWPYDTILAQLRDAPGLTGEELAALVVRHYVDQYTQNPPKLNAGDVTKVALDLARVNEIAGAVDRLAGELLADMDNQADLLWEAQFETREKEMSERDVQYTKFGYYLWDLGSLAAYLAENSENPAVNAAAIGVRESLKPGGAVKIEKHLEEWFDGIGGVSIYAVPPNQERISPYYAEVALAQDTHWDEMLVKYHEALS